MTLFQFAIESIDLFIEYRDVHGYKENDAKNQAALDMSGHETFFQIVDTDDLKKLKEKADLSI